MEIIRSYWWRQMYLELIVFGSVGSLWCFMRYNGDMTGSSGSYASSLLRQQQHDFEFELPSPVGVSASKQEADYSRDPRTYVLIPCSVSALVSLAMLISSVYFKTFLTSTSGLYCSVGLFLLHVTFMLLYLPSGFYWHSEEKHWNYFNTWFIVYHGILLTYITLQIVMWLRRFWRQRSEEKPWPVFHGDRIFTFNMLLTFVRMVLTAYAFYAHVMKEMMKGRHSSILCMSNNCQYIKYPEAIVYPSAVICLFGLVLSFEALMSYVAGHSDKVMMGYLGLTSAFVYIIPLVMVSQIDVYITNIDILMAVCIVTSIHALCLIVPVPDIKAEDEDAEEKNGLRKVTGDEDTDGEDIGTDESSLLEGTSEGREDIVLHLMLVVLTASTFLFVNLDPYIWKMEHYGPPLLLCGNLLVMLRSLYVVVKIIFFKDYNNLNPVNALFLFSVEGTLITVGGVGCFFQYSSLLDACILNIFIMFVLICDVCSDKKVRGTTKMLIALHKKDSPLDEKQLLETTEKPLFNEEFFYIDIPDVEKKALKEMIKTEDEIPPGVRNGEEDVEPLEATLKVVQNPPENARQVNNESLEDREESVNYEKSQQCSGTDTV